VRSNREDVGRRAADEGDGAQLGTGVDARVHRVQITPGERIVAEERGDLDEAIVVDVDDDHVVEGRHAGALTELGTERRRDARELDGRTRRAQYHRSTCLRHA